MIFWEFWQSLSGHSARVFFNQEEVDALGLEVDHTDDLAISGSDSFALLLHGVQPKGSESAAALKELKQKGFTGYNNKDKCNASM